MTTCVPWTPNYACDDQWVMYDPDLQDRATDLAWASLRHLTAGRVGHCPVRIRPCRTDCMGGVMVYEPFIRGGEWYNAGCARHGSRCECGHLSEVLLPGEVARIDAVYQGGALVDPTEYRLDDRRVLVALNGREWPTCQDMSQDFDGADAFAIDYVPGVQPSSAGLWAAGVLASEFAKACSGGKCRLPASVTSVARQGVSMEFSQGFFANGQTGIREVDAYVLTLNPKHLAVQPRVWSPDMRTGRFVS